MMKLWKVRDGQHVDVVAAPTAARALIICPGGGAVELSDAEADAMPAVSVIDANHGEFTVAGWMREIRAEREKARRGDESAKRQTTLFGGEK